MAPLPPPPNGLAQMIDKAHEAAPNLTRPHMGASLLGHPCERFLWLNFRWAVVEQLEGRMLRLFRRGHREEETILADLVKAGVKIVTTQAPVDFGSHVSGSADAIVDNVPEAPKSRHLAEFKTHSDKSFNQLVKDGVEKAKPQHWAQMQVYMLGLGLARALYVAVNKNDDRLHIERIRLDQDAAKKLVERGRRLAVSDRLPPPLSTDPSWWQCKFCPAYSFCHQAEPTKEVNCRTCALSTAKADSTFECERWKTTIPVDAQRQGCWGHVLHPDLVPWEWAGGTEGSATYIIDGEIFVNGEDGEASGDLLNLYALRRSPIGRAVMEAFPDAEVVRAS